MSWLQSLHGYVAVLGLALALHPWFALRRATRPSKGTRLTGWLASATLLTSSAAGWLIYPDYRDTVRRALYAADVRYGLGFEIKEHLAAFALALALAGAVLLRPGPPKVERRLRGAVRTTYLLAALLGLASAGLGIWLSGLKALPTQLP
jgi:hypothetical protein